MMLFSHIGCFDWKIGVFQQTVRVYCIINVPIQSTCQTLSFNESCLTYIYTKMVHFHMGCTKRMKTFFNLNNTRIPNSITKFCKVTQRVLLGDIGQFTFSPFSWRSEKVFQTQHFLFFFGSWKPLHTKSKQTKCSFHNIDLQLCAVILFFTRTSLRISDWRLRFTLMKRCLSNTAKKSLNAVRHHS